MFDWVMNFSKSKLQNCGNKSDTNHRNEAKLVNRRSLCFSHCEAIKIIRNSHYEVAMPWIPDAPNASNNYSQALVRLGQLKRKFEKNAKFR